MEFCYRVTIYERIIIVFYLISNHRMRLSMLVVEMLKQISTSERSSSMTTFSEYE